MNYPRYKAAVTQFLDLATTTGGKITSSIIRQPEDAGDTVMAFGTVVYPSGGHLAALRRQAERSGLAVRSVVKASTAPGELIYYWFPWQGPQGQANDGWAQLVVSKGVESPTTASKVKATWDMLKLPLLGLVVGAGLGAGAMWYWGPRRTKPTGKSPSS